MLYLARFRGYENVLVGAANADAALARLRSELEIDETPKALVELPDELVAAQVIWASPDDEDDDGDEDDGDDDEEEDDDAEQNPANYADGGVVLEPYGEFAEWLAADDVQADLVEGGT